MASATYHAIATAIEQYLFESGSTGPHNSKNNRQIVAHIRGLVTEGKLVIDVADGTILNYLSNAAADANSKVISGGPRRGYWYAAPTETAQPKAPDVEEISQPAGGPKTTVQERDLYPLMELWLESKGYTTKDVSTLKAGGKWGNPDNIGVDRVDVFGAVEIDLASCEVKLSDKDWELVIFEAISHKRFSNRSWFCYRTESEDAPLPKGIEYYAEKYRVGIVQIVLSDSQLLALKARETAPIEHVEDVIERIPALYDHVPLREKSDLIDRTGISLTLKF